MPTVVGALTNDFNRLAHRGGDTVRLKTENSMRGYVITKENIYNRNSLGTVRTYRMYVSLTQVQTALIPIHT